MLEFLKVLCFKDTILSREEEVLLPLLNLMENFTV